MNMEIQSAFLMYQVVFDGFFHLLYYHYRSTYFTYFIRVFFFGIYYFFWANPLSCYLYQTKFTRRENFVPCFISLHLLFQMVIKFFTMLGIAHIYEIHHYYPAHISQSELSSYLCCCDFIYI